MTLVSTLQRVRLARWPPVARAPTTSAFGRPFLGRTYIAPNAPADRRTKDAGKQHGQNGGQKDPIKSSSTADRGNRRTQPLHLPEIEEVRAMLPPM